MIFRSIITCFGLLLGSDVVAQVEPTISFPDTTSASKPADVLSLPQIVSLDDANLHTQQSAIQLADVEALALSLHPTLAEAAALIEAAKCHTLQVGLPPNPTVGYSGTEIGNEGRAGQQGFFVGQKFIRGNKLELNRVVACQEVKRLEQELAAQRLRILTNVRTLFFEVYLAQRELELTIQLEDLSAKAAESVHKLFAADEVRKTDLIQAEIENKRIQAKLRGATATLHAAWRQLAAAAGQPNWEVQAVVADPDSLNWPYSWEDSRESLLHSSPEIAAAVAQIARARAIVQRSCAEPISDINTQLSVQYDDATQDTVTSVQVGMPLPLWNRNQGGIGKAKHELRAAKQQLEGLELRLTKKLAVKTQDYEVAKAQAQTFRNEILQRADENLRLVRQAFDSGESNYLDLLTVQRTYFESNLDYINALREVNASVQLLSGLMLGAD